MTPEEFEKRRQEIHHALVNLSPEVRAKLAEDLSDRLRETARRFAWNEVLKLPKAIAEEEEGMAIMGLLDTGIEAGCNAMMRVLANREPLPPQPEVPHYREIATASVDKELKTNPIKRDQYNERLAQYGFEVDETTIGDL